MPNYGVLLVVGASGKQKTARKRERAVETMRITAVRRGAASIYTPMPSGPHSAP